MEQYTKTVLTVIAVCLVLLITKEVVIETTHAFSRSDLNRCLDGARIDGYVLDGYADLELRTRC